MPVEDDADRAAFLDADEHGVVVTYTTLALAVSSFNAIFENAYEGTDAGQFAEVSTQTPQLTMQTSDVPATSAEGDRIQFTFEGVAYDLRRVGDVEDDGTGMSLMRLNSP